MRLFVKSRTHLKFSHCIIDADGTSNYFDDQLYGHFMITNSWQNGAFTTLRQHESRHMHLSKISNASRIRP